MSDGVDKILKVRQVQIFDFHRYYWLLLEYLKVTFNNAKTALSLLQPKNKGEKMKIYALVIIMVSLLSVFGQKSQAQLPEKGSAPASQQFSCTPTLKSQGLGANWIRQNMPSLITLTFAADQSLLVATAIFSRNNRSIVFNQQNTKISTVTGGDNPVYNPSEETSIYYSQDWGNGLGGAISFKTTDFRGQKYSPSQSVVGEWIYQNINGPYMDGKLWFSVTNSKFPAQWGAAYSCQ